MDKKEDHINEMIENNLYDFYLSIAQHPGINVLSYSNAKHIRCDKQWPNCMFLNQQLNPLDSNLISPPPSVPIFLSTRYVKANLDIIKNLNLIPIRSWTNMILKQEAISALNKSKQTSNLIISKVNTREKLMDFAQLINENIYTEGFIDAKFLEDKLDDTSYNFFLGSINGKPISTILTFDNGTTIGLYFISVVENERGIGHGKSIVTHAITTLKEEPKNFVLHARKTGAKLYHKIGFETKDKMNIFVTK